MAKKIKITAITGIRSEYELLYPVLMEIQKKENLELSVIVTGAHNSHNFGYTIRDIENDGFKIAGVIENLINSNSLIGKAKSSGILLSSLPELLHAVKPDLAIALGDREEPLLTAIVCNYLNIPFAHVAGGDRAFPEAGDADEGVRHATTKLAHLHFAMMKEHAERILKLGEEKWRVFTVGNPGLDRLRLTEVVSKEALSARLKIDLAKKKNVVVIQHVINQEACFAGLQMKTTLNALAKVDANILIIYPNSDAGSLELIEVIDSYLPNNANFRAFKNLPRVEFVNLLRNADLLIGNSSAGILEAPFLKLPTVNVGDRQKHRLHSDNVAFVPFDEDLVLGAVNTALHDENYLAIVKECNSIYGDGFSGKRIADILSNEVEFNAKLLAKDITY